jgi:hypothetical protein
VHDIRTGPPSYGWFVSIVHSIVNNMQETLNLTGSLGVFVRVRAGLDIIRREASWEFQSLDPLTGKRLLLIPNP